jgi:hypothetical protein
VVEATYAAMDSEATISATVNTTVDATVDATARTIMSMWRAFGNLLTSLEVVLEQQ